MTQITLGQIVADFETSLATAMAVGATSATLLSADDDDFNEIPPGRYFLTIDGNNSQKEHISCTLNAEALTDIKSLSRQGVEASGCLRPHRVGAKVVLTDFAHIKKINDLLDGTTDFDPSVVLAYSGTANITSDHQLATKLYIDSGILQGAADAGKTTKGIAFMSTGPASATGPIAVGDNDTRLPTQDENDALVGSSGTASSTNKYVTEADVSSAGATGKVVRADATGKIGSSMLTGPLPAIDGSDLTGVTDTQIVDLNGYIGTQSLALGENTITSGYQSVWRVCHINGYGGVGGTPAPYSNGEVTLFKTGKTSGQFSAVLGGSSAIYGYSAAVGATGTKITISVVGTATGAGGDAYYYR